MKLLIASIVAFSLLVSDAHAVDRYAGLTRAQAVAKATAVLTILNGGRKVPEPSIVRRVVYFDCQNPTGVGCPNSRRIAWYVFWRGKGCVYVSKRYGAVIGPSCRWR